eukprot:CAMPEP_0195121808 /NCGR_PEP_ID=MMETSP0448-20130528/125070_1 /TAXON_ID=66468 /ORGANISM="Heterocapsa triquestra, Strain CCMP 448" /LENGTH=206 /DNA_ID=CAMNT_0040159285 /DNA_START=42 /DNA_END=662 /DNA_ORIENTATION=+
MPTWWNTLCSGKDGALGPGSEDMSKDQADATLEEYRRTFHKDGGDPLRKHNKDLACSACRMAANRFQNKVARKVKGKMSESQKRSTFKSNLDQVCVPSAFPKQAAIVEKNGKEKYVDFQDAMANREGKVNVRRMSPEIRDDLVNACKHVLLVEFKDALLQQVLQTPKGQRASDTDFKRWLCGPKQAAVCEADDDDEVEDEDNEAEL